MEIECKERFIKIEDRLEQGSEVMIEHGKSLVKVSTDVNNLTKSLDNLTKALWGLVASFLVVVITYLVNWR